MTGHARSDPNDASPPTVTPALVADIQALLGGHGWYLDENGQTALICALWQLANRPGTTAVGDGDHNPRR